MNIISWNVRGFNDETRRALHDHCKRFSPILMGIYEPKNDFIKIPTAFWNSIGLFPAFQNFRHGRSPNIWVCAAPHVTVSLVFSSNQTIIVDCTWKNFSFRAAFIHGDNSPSERRRLWIDLLTFIVGKVVCIGDFNAVKGAHERKSTCLPNATSCTEFGDFISASGMIESNTTGLFFTWYGRRNMPSHVESVLDRCLFSNDFADLWDSLNTHVLPRFTSDHSPLIFQCFERAAIKHRPFKFLNMWLVHQDFRDFVKNSWKEPIGVSCPLLKIMVKLKRLRTSLKRWNKEVFGHVDVGINQFQAALERVQQRIAVEGYSAPLFDKEVEIQARLGTMLLRKDLLLKQKSRIRWLNDGDRNTNFFHNSIKVRRKQLHLPQLNIDGTDSFDQDEIAAHIVSYFSTLFSDSVATHVTTDDVRNLVNNSVSQTHNSLLTSTPLDEEIKAAVFDLGGDSAAGPDGFTGIFFQHCWEIIKADICLAVRTFFIKNYLPQGLNSNTLILIPKKEVVTTVADLRPIVLSNFFFKILSKILASRLSSVAADCVSQNQFGFIRGRLIHDCIMIGSEGVNCMNRSCNGKNMACKVDIKKAFDTLSWRFILCAMEAMGFDQRFLNWISTIFGSARISILYNGQLCGYFSCSRGVRQGDPLSPIIFGIAEDVLSCMFMKAVKDGCLTPMSMSRANNFPTHLLYADDILLFCKASTKNARTIRNILQRYGELSGQICSREKSHIYFAKGVSLSYQRQIGRILHFRVGLMPMTYLGAPLFVGRPKAIHLAAIKDRIIHKFSRWNGSQLSIAGRICLIRSVIQSSLVHTMMVYKWPNSLLKELDRSCRNFIWTGNVNKRPTCAVSWDRACAIKEEGGLGIRSFETMNDSFLMKLAWKVIGRRQFGFDMMRCRYLNEASRPRSALLTSSIWIGIRKLIPDLLEDSYCLLGKGASVYFWHDDWLGYSIADKINLPNFMRSRLNQTVSNYFYDGVWHFSQEFIDEFPYIICDILLLPIGEEEDVRLWKPSVHGEVTSALAFASKCHRFPTVNWGRWLWENYIPVRRSITCWRVILNRLPTRDKLIRQGLISPNYCSLCFHEAEDLNHIFWSCDKIQPVWTEFLGWFNQMDGRLCADIHSFLIFSWSIKVSSQINALWKLGVISVIWAIWNARNKSHFDGVAFHGRAILCFIKSTFMEVDISFPKLGCIDNTWTDYLTVRQLGVSVHQRPPPDFTSVYWSPPAYSWIKANTDGSAVGAPGRICAGGVFRDWRGFVRGCFHVEGGTGFAFEAELLGIITAIDFAHQCGWFKIWIEADSTYVVSILSTKSDRVPWRFKALWRRTLSLLDNMEFRITHIFREGNVPADIMASPHTPEGRWNHNIQLIHDAVIRDFRLGFLLGTVSFDFIRTLGGRSVAALEELLRLDAGDGRTWEQIAVNFWLCFLDGGAWELRAPDCWCRRLTGLLSATSFRFRFGLSEPGWFGGDG
ncbi:uncharacterized protein LOC130993749 [Salvia miltiorrhiza]|uniref:uncharacterized protein LOC130993749 n=1 Tax=Salvia miltiorrhiza TaxID=226208 RepID=UPI0025AD8E70|nr:uncharacterized protein LOC130993749 [Salvia miltiorrhiza]